MNGLCLVAVALCTGVTLPANAQAPPVLLLKPARVFDGQVAEPHENWVVLVRGERIERVGPADQVEVPADARVLALPKMTLLPGLIEAHSHLLLHPYNEAPWDEQILKELLTGRVFRAGNHAPST